MQQAFLLTANATHQGRVDVQRPRVLRPGDQSGLEGLLQLL